MRDRLDAAQTIGAVVQTVAQGRSGVRPAAVLVDVPYTTATGWVRSFVRNASCLAVGFSALCVELGDGGSCLLCLEWRDEQENDVDDGVRVKIALHRFSVIADRDFS
jgi:hypothetical protein